MNNANNANTNNVIKMSGREDFDKEVKLRGIKIPCYSKDQLEELYPNDDWLLVGETKAKNRKKVRSQLYLSDVIDIRNLDVDDLGNEIPFGVSRVGTYNKVFYRRAGYIPVAGEKDTYISLLKFRFAFLWLLFGLIAGIGVLIGLLLSLWFGGHGPSGNSGDTSSGPIVLNPMPPADSNAQKDESDTESQVPIEEGGFVSMSYRLKATLSLSTGQIKIYFQNPGKSNHNVSVALYLVSGDTEVMIAESGVIEPGYSLQQLDFQKDSAVLSVGEYEGKYKVAYYNPETGERAVVESEIVNVSLTVTE